jgi:hypothetical protein
MKISKKRIDAICRGISDPVWDLRVKLGQGKIVISQSVLFDLEQTIRQKVMNALDIGLT